MFMIILCFSLFVFVLLSTNTTEREK
ncbi:hypothetical protein M8C21_017496 [Ambrosia artemisiifolia]|uniref:Uncharacterized protein n=1 Tax=Ambrosia artemisiifolia TaxID=4212 RepID=A0AAD5G7X7_AMBAR|nr:hypothetical protein M8C21_017496 [Ambrosia artemisiifolia]